jgi:hypothetical protein
MATKTTPAARKSQQPPDERFWVKYSPHHELPISGMASLTWHVLVGVLIVVVGFIVARSRSNDMPIETVEYPGGGGNPNGVGNAPGIGGAPMVEAASTQQPPADAIRVAEPLVENVPLQIAPADLLPGIEDDPEAQRELVKITERGNQALRKLEKLDADFRKSLLGPPGHGRGGPGSGGGQGTGAGQGQGDGSGSGKINTRTQRQLRWTLTFNIKTGSDYLRQLDVLHAILAFRHPDGSLKVVKNLLQRPLKLEDDDVKGLNRIFWIDDDPASVDKMARALGLEFTPREFVALFPPEFENELAKKERSYRNRREDQIFRTRFAVTILGNSPSVVVADQIPNGQ